jgi:hypothetical protein
MLNNVIKYIQNHIIYAYQYVAIYSQYYTINIFLNPTPKKPEPNGKTKQPPLFIKTKGKKGKLK